MDVIDLALDGVKLIRPRVFRDDRGHFLETWRRDRYADNGIPGDFVQDNVAFSRAGVLRGLHYQWPRPQGKLVMAVHGEVFDVAVDIRRGSPTFARWVGQLLSAENGQQLWIPEGFAHGYVVTSDTDAVVAYKCTRAYAPEHDRAIRWDDPDIGIGWPVTRPVLSEKDAAAARLADVAEEELPAVE